MKRAQGLSLQVIIIAIIVIIVAAVLIAIFMGVVREDAVPFIGGLTECGDSEESYCVSSADTCRDEGGTPVKLGCEGEWCCRK